MTQYATYCPEDNKLRLYVGRVPRDEYEKLRADGWTSTPKQDCDFVAVWTVSRRKTALEYSEGVILDEDMGPDERAADRAERFGEYRDKRFDEAIGHADRYDGTPAAHGFQSQARAERSARRHDRVGGYAVDAWSKAQYWTHRTAGVISHALHVAGPGVRMGRIKELEAEQRKLVKSVGDYMDRFRLWKRCEALRDPQEQFQFAYNLANTASDGHHYHHPRPESATAYDREHGTSLYSLLTQERDPITGAEAAALWMANSIDPEDGEAWAETGWFQRLNHLELRLSYENQMLQGQGGRAAFVEMEVGGWIGSHQIRKVNKSNATGRVVSVTVAHPSNGCNKWGNPVPNAPAFHLHVITVERMPENAYRPPTLEDKQALQDKQKAEKKAAPKVDPCPLINPTDEDAERLQALWNSNRRKDAEEQKVLRMTQAQYSNNSGGTYTAFETVILNEHGRRLRDDNHYMSGFAMARAKVCKVRVADGKGSGFYLPRRVIVITDKPQKAIPFARMEELRASFPTVEKMRPKLPLIQADLGKPWLSDMNEELIRDAYYIGWVNVQSVSQISWTDAGRAALKEFQEAEPQPMLSALFAASESLA